MEIRCGIINTVGHVPLNALELDEHQLHSHTTVLTLAMIDWMAMQGSRDEKQHLIGRYPHADKEFVCLLDEDSRLTQISGYRIS